MRRFRLEWISALTLLVVWGVQANASPQTFYVDFDTVADADPELEGRPPEDRIYEYATDQRTMILDYLNMHYNRYGMTFVAGTKPAPGSGSNITLNGGLGAGAEQVDFRNLDDGDDAKANILSVFEDFLGVTDYTDDEVALGTANAIAHEAEHLMGMRHHDKANPVGMGLGGGLSPSDFSPVYPGPSAAALSSETFSSLHAGGALSFSNLTTPKIVSERVTPRLLVAVESDDFTIAEVPGTGGNNSVETAMTIDPKPFAQPYPFLETPIPGLDIIDGRALVVTGDLSTPSVGGDGFKSDYYEFTGEAGEVWTIEAMSYILPDPDGDGTRYADNADVALALLAGEDAPAPFGEGSLIPYYSGDALTDDDDDADDVPASAPFDSYYGATLFDVILPYSGTYVIEVAAASPFVGAGKDGGDGGAYELYLYTARPLPEPGTSAFIGLASIGWCMRRGPRRGLD